MAQNYDVNYDDERFQQVNTDKQQAMTELEQTYGGMINESDKYYQAQIDASKEWADKQSQLQQEQTDFTIEQIQQQKDKAKLDYTKEQSAAYVDWQKQSNKYGSNAEQMAGAGMAGTGFSESSQVSMYNTYQNRVSTARESFNQAILNYNNSITEARLQNNSVLAQIAYEALQTQLELSLQGFQYKNNLILEQTNKKQELDNTYYQRYQDVLDQINTENAFQYQQGRDEIADNQWQANYDEQVRQFNQEYAFQREKFDESIRQFEVEIERLKKNDAQEYELQIEELELKKSQLEEEKRQWEEEMKLKREQFAESMKAGSSSGIISKPSGSSGGTSSSSSSSSGNYGRTDVDMDSVLSLGYGPISAERAYELVKEGLAETYTKDGVTYFRKISAAFKPGQLFGG